MLAPGNTQCSKFSRRTLRFAPTNLRLLGRLTPSCRGKIKGNQQALNEQKDEVMSIRKMDTIMSRQ